uniref:Uncharacterized protein n=1 Tax=Parascaris univalens TaxID=6257 RepID=A0A915B5J4_PARUN
LAGCGCNKCALVSSNELLTCAGYSQGIAMLGIHFKRTDLTIYVSSQIHSSLLRASKQLTGYAKTAATICSFAFHSADHPLSCDAFIAALAFNWFISLSLHYPSHVLCDLVLIFR